MDIRRILVKKKLDRFHKQLTLLDKEISQYPPQDVENLKIFVRLKLQEAELLSVAMDHLEDRPDPNDRHDIDEMFRRLKMNSRAAFLRWRRFLANQGRLEKKRLRRHLQEQIAN